MAHLLSCRLLDEACTADDLATVTERAKACARKCEYNCAKDSNEEDQPAEDVRPGTGYRSTAGLHHPRVRAWCYLPVHISRSAPPLANYPWQKED